MHTLSTDPEQLFISFRFLSCTSYNLKNAVLQKHGEQTALSTKSTVSLVSAPTFIFFSNFNLDILPIL